MSPLEDLLVVKKFTPLLNFTLGESPSWTRLEPQATSGDPTPGIEARLHDPLWSLLRQWQLAEFAGEDAGTPITVEVRTRTSPVTAWQPGDPTSRRRARPVDPTLPLDALVEPEPVGGGPLGLWDRAEAGAYLVELLEEAGADLRTALVEACPLDVSPAPEDVEIPAQHAVPGALAVLARTTPDGAAAAAQLAAGDPSWLAGASPAAEDAAAAWARWFRAALAPPEADSSWIEDRFEYRFSIRVGSDEDHDVLAAPIHEGGAVDWFTFDHAPRRSLTLEEEERTEDLQESLTMVATPLRFAGMPADRYWQFEDAQVHLGQLDAQPHDLARLCVAEFAMVYGNDWLVVPLTVHGGSLTRIESVAYTTTFGERFEVRAADDSRRTGRFRMFAIAEQGAPARTFPGLLIPPTALGVIDGSPLEDVAFLRDEAANMAWAVERTVQARSGDPRSRGDEERPVNQVQDLEAPGELQYILQTEVPRHWIPFVPISTGIGHIALRKGTMAEEDLSLGVVLDPTPLTVQDEEVPREGLRVRRVPALARAADGRYLRWITRRVSVGRGEGWSGLSFDGTFRP